MSLISPKLFMREFPFVNDTECNDIKFQWIELKDYRDIRTQLTPLPLLARRQTGFAFATLSHLPSSLAGARQVIKLT